MFNDFFRPSLLGLLLVSLPSLSHAAPPIKVGGGTIVSNKVGTYYSVRPDLRRCISPLCGGYWVKAVNSKTTLCADGSRRSECYAADVAWEKLGLDGSAGASLVLGILQPTDFPGFGPMGRLIPQAAWRAASSATPKGSWYGIKDKGLRCITYPCYSLEERLLNRRATQDLSAVNLNSVQASKTDIEAAYEALYNSELIAVGENVVSPNDGPAGDGLSLTASQFYLPVTSKTTSDLYCESNSDCTLTAYRSFVSSSDECYCPLCPVPLNAHAAQKNQKSWQQHCSNFGFSASNNKFLLACPQVLCIAPDPVGCAANQCATLTSEPLWLR